MERPPNLPSNKDPDNMQPASQLPAVGSKEHMAKFDDFDGPPMTGKTGIPITASQRATIDRLKAEGARRRAARQAANKS